MRSFTSFKYTERDALLILNAINGFGIKRIRRLIERFGSAAEALRAPVDALLDVKGLPQASRINLQSFSSEDFLKMDHAACEKFGARVVTFLDDEYPAGLHNIPDPPAVLYVSGTFPKRLDCAVGIVGARRASLYGLHIAERFAVELAELGIPIISGLARGVDAAAHKGALRAGGDTMAVLGCGLDVIYPPENRELYNEIRRKGCLISEFPFGYPPLPVNFPRRNRIVSGLALGIVVVEANIKSGALITAGFALEQGREVFAVPGRIDNDMSGGPHALIKQGAKAVVCIEDILEELPLEVIRPVSDDHPKQEEVRVRGISGDERRVFDLIKDGHETYEDLEALTGLGPTMLMASLLALELRGKIVQKPGHIYALKA
jgi:DNA processing protein